MTSQFELIYSQEERLQAKDNINNLCLYISENSKYIDESTTNLFHELESISVNVFEATNFIRLFKVIKQLDSDTKNNFLLKDKIVGDIMFGILDVYEDLVEDAFIIIQFFNKLNCILNKKLIILSFIEILKKNRSFKQKILEEINYLAEQNSLENWEFLKDAVKEINDKFLD
jgi:hypothetical protein